MATVSVRPDSNPSDADLIARSIPVPQEFGAIFDRHVAAVHAFVARRLGPDVADDVAGEVFVVAFEQRRSFDLVAESALPWLYGIAVNVLRRRARRSVGLHRALVRAVAGAETYESEPAAGLIAREEREWLSQALPRALDRLAPQDKDALLLHCWERLSYDEIAIALGIPVGTVRSRINRARRLVRAELGDFDTLELPSGGQQS